MPDTVRLTVLTGPHKGHRYCIRNAGATTIGRSAVCDICVCGDERDRLISRKHCQLTLDLPMVQVEDLGSLNGTYINGIQCPMPFVGEVRDPAPRRVPAKDGDILTVGGTSFEVNIVDCYEWVDETPIKEHCAVAC